MAKTKLYIAGKINGDPDFESKFLRAKQLLNGGSSYAILTPAELPAGMAQVDYMTLCLSMVAMSDVIMFLPDWPSSPGATIEYAYAKYLNKDIMYLTDDNLILTESQYLETNPQSEIKVIAEQGQTRRQTVISGKSTLRSNFEAEGPYINTYSLLITVVKLPTGALEVISNTTDLQSKHKYLLSAYDENMCLKANSEVRIVDYILA